MFRPIFKFIRHGKIIDTECNEIIESLYVKLSGYQIPPLSFLFQHENHLWQSGLCEDLRTRQYVLYVQKTGFIFIQRVAL